ncbi:hypothetical protein MKEN_00145200 [Mycena kentingensis (nom. inval.)]|nr:hypothetical protein MKEN_00145200 [Mycena kentingensis (nom. inval.)]
MDLLGVWFCSCGALFPSLAISGRVSAMDVPLFLGVLHAYSAKIASLSVDVDAEDIALFDALDMAELREVSVSLSPVTTEDPEMFPLDTFLRSAPKLCKVRLYRTIPSESAIPWSQITHFHAELSSAEETFRALKLLPNVARFETTILSQYFPMSRDVNQRRLVHPHLQELTLHEWNRRPDELHILHFLILPALESLDTNDINRVILSEFMERSKPPLKRLSIIGDADLSFDAPALERLDQLVELTLRNPSWIVTRSLLEVLEPRVSEPLRFPVLRNLSLVCREAENGRQQTGFLHLAGLAARAVMYRNTRTKGTRIMEFSLLFEPAQTLDWLKIDIPEPLLGLWKKLREDGVEVHLASTKHIVL